MADSTTNALNPFQDGGYAGYQNTNQLLATPTNGPRGPPDRVARVQRFARTGAKRRGELSR